MNSTLTEGVAAVRRIALGSFFIGALLMTTSTQADESESAYSVMKTWFETVNPDLLHDDVEWIVPGYPVDQEVYVGKEAVFSVFFPALTSQFSEWGAETERMIDGGDDVTVIGRYIGKTHSGQSVTIPFIHVWTVQNGKITRVISGANTAVFSEVLQ
ncbi:MAG: hypothetical protein Cons2KO_28740 [Congregibacter sp.]